jgi:hypothetical protein
MHVTSRVTPGSDNPGVDIVGRVVKPTQQLVARRYGLRVTNLGHPPGVMRRPYVRERLQTLRMSLESPNAAGFGQAGLYACGHSSGFRV